MPLDLNILGEGVYSPREAARLIGSTPQEVLRWTRGSGPNEPLWHGYYQDLEDATDLSFSDLVELRVVKAFRRVGISLQAIRFAIQFAQEKFGIKHPLSSLGFKTDGKEILTDALEKDGEYVSLSRKHPGQKVFAEIVRQSLNDLEYEDDIAVRWRPANAKGVILDPTRFFGDPILDRYGISTRTIAEEYGYFDDAKYLSIIYEIPEAAIREALKYEAHLDAQSQDGKASV